MLILIVVAATGFVMGRVCSVASLLVLVISLIGSMTLSHLVRQTDLHGDLVIVAIDLLLLEGFYLAGALSGRVHSRAQ